MTDCPICKKEIIITKETSYKMHTECGCCDDDGEIVRYTLIRGSGKLDKFCDDIIKAHIQMTKALDRDRAAREERWRDRRTDDAISKGVFNTTNYGERARGTYNRELVMWPGRRCLEVDVGEEYYFKFDRDVVEDMIKALQRSLELMEKEVDEKKERSM